MTLGCAAVLGLSMAVAAAVPIWLAFHWKKTMTAEEADHPPADYQTRMRRAKNLGSEADYLARRERFYQERNYKRMLANQGSALLARAMDEFDREFGG